MPNVPIERPDTSFHPIELTKELKLIGQIRKTPLVLYGIFLELVRQFYSKDENQPIDISKVWDRDVAKTEIWIDTEYVWEDESPEFRPAIYVKLGDIKFSSYTGRHDGLAGMDIEQGEYHYSRTGDGQVSWVHIARAKTEAVLLSGSTLDYIDALSDIIRRDFCFDTFKVINLSPLSLDKESRERYRSIVTASFSYQDTWAIKRESPKLKKIVINAGQGLLANGILG